MKSKIGMRIRFKREEAGMTQEELATKLGYKSKTTIAKIESGANDIVQSKVVMFAQALETTVSYLMGWEMPEMDENGFITLDPVFRIEIAEKLNEKMLERNTPIKALAKRSKTEEKEIKSIVSGAATSIHIDTLKEIATALDSNISFFTDQTWDSISMDLSDIEANMVRAYRDNPDKQHPVNKFLGVWDNPPEHEDDPTVELQKIAFWDKYYSIDERGRKMVDTVLEQEYAHAKSKINFNNHIKKK